MPIYQLETLSNVHHSFTISSSFRLFYNRQPPFLLPDQAVMAPSASSKAHQGSPTRQTPPKVSQQRNPGAANIAPDTAPLCTHDPSWRGVPRLDENRMKKIPQANAASGHPSYMRQEETIDNAKVYMTNIKRLE